MKPDLILVADATEARLYAREGDALRPLADLADPGGRHKSSELADDRLGHDRTDHRPGGISFTARLPPKRKRHLKFAQQVAQRVDAELAGGQYARFALFAGSPFLGDLKQALGAAAHAPRLAVDIDLTGLRADELRERVRHELKKLADPPPHARA